MYIYIYRYLRAKEHGGGPFHLWQLWSSVRCCRFNSGPKGTAKEIPGRRQWLAGPTLADSGWARAIFTVVFCVCLVLAVWQLANRHSSIANGNSSRTIGDAVTPLAGQKPGVLAPPVEGLVWPPRPQRWVHSLGLEVWPIGTMAWKVHP